MHCVFLCTSFRHFPFWRNGTRLAPPDVKEAYCIRTYMILLSWQHVKAVCFIANFLPNGSEQRQRSGRMKAAGCWFESGWCVGDLERTLTAGNANLMLCLGAITTSYVCVQRVLYAEQPDKPNSLFLSFSSSIE